jgi:hypothetical protein
MGASAACESGCSSVFVTLSSQSEVSRPKSHKAGFGALRAKAHENGMPRLTHAPAALRKEVEHARHAACASCETAAARHPFSLTLESLGDGDISVHDDAAIDR